MSRKLTQAGLETRPFVAGDWVRPLKGGPVGIIKRLGKDWADVDWGAWTKRMKLAYLKVETTIPFGNGMTVTDMTREKAIRTAEEAT